MDQHIIYQKTDITDEEISRVKRVHVPYRAIVQWAWQQKQLPEYVAFPTLNLPEGFVVLRAALSFGGMSVEFYVYHPSFEPVREGEVPPRFGESASAVGPPSYLWYNYALATEEELATRRKALFISDPE